LVQSPGTIAFSTAIPQIEPISAGTYFCMLT
jgi:hypothetical protein